MCDACEREYIRYMAAMHETDLLAALDPEPEERLRREFAEWVEQQ